MCATDLHAFRHFAVGSLRVLLQYNDPDLVACNMDACVNTRTQYSVSQASEHKTSGVLIPTWSAILQHQHHLCCCQESEGLRSVPCRAEQRSEATAA